MADQAASIFTGSDQNLTPEAKQAAAQAKAAAGDPQSPLAILVGEGRKYKTVDELAKAYVSIDDFAEKLKGENASLRTEVTKAKTLDEVLERLKAESGSAAQDQGANKVDASKGAPGLTTTDVAAIVRSTLTGMESTRTKEANLLKADAEMRKLFGDKAEAMFQKEASTPEMKKALMDLASVSPEKFVALFRPAKVDGSSVDHGTSVNSAALGNEQASGRATDPGCKEFYNELRRKKPSEYYSQAMQLQMNKVAVANPDKFFGG